MLIWGGDCTVLSVNCLPSSEKMPMLPLENKWEACVKLLCIYFMVLHIASIQCPFMDLWDQLPIWGSYNIHGHFNVDGKCRSCREESWHLQRPESFRAFACILILRKQIQIIMNFYVWNEEKEREIPQTRMCKIRMAFSCLTQNIWRQQEHL